MTWNVKFGGDLVGLVGSLSDVNAAPRRMAKLWDDVQASNFPERAGVIARQIAATSPALIGLEEMAYFRIQDPGDAITGGATPATNVVLDFLRILQDSLAGRGLSYRVAASQENADLEIPALVAGTTDQYIDIRYTDRNVILARNDVATSNGAGAVYVTTISAPLYRTVSGTRITMSNLRGWVATDATVGGVTYRFVTTHLESRAVSATAYQEPQARELIALLVSETRPLILVCDCNSAADGSTSRSYGWLVSAADQGGGGFVDVWIDANPRDPGYTARLPESLFGPAQLTERIDLILVRQGFRVSPAAGIVGGVQAMVIGEEEGDKTVSGRWPSDHAGVVAILHLPKALGNR